MSENINKVKTILGVTDTSLDDYLKFCEDSITNEIKDFCNIDEIPESFNTHIQEFLMEQYAQNKNGYGIGELQVSGASDNGQSVNFKTVGGIENMSKNVDEFIKRKAHILVQYRKLRW